MLQVVLERRVVAVPRHDVEGTVLHCRREHVAAELIQQYVVLRWGLRLGTGRGDAR